MDMTPLRLDEQMMVSSPATEGDNPSRRVMRLRGTPTCVADALRATDLRFQLVPQHGRRIRFAA